MTLIELTSEYKALLDMGENLEPEEQQTFLDTLDGLTGELAEKVDSYVVVIKELETQAEKLRTESNRLRSAADGIDANITQIKSRAKYAMEQMGKNELKGDYHRMKIAGNGGLQPLKITGEVPDSYKKIIYENDNQKIRKALEAGGKLDFAELEERGTHLKIS